MPSPDLPAPVEAAVDRYLRLVDRVFPGRAVGLYVVGSVAHAAYRRARSDIDLIVVVNRRFDRSDLRRLRTVQLLSAACTVPPAVARRRFRMPGTCNASYVLDEDLALPVSTILPVASHVGHFAYLDRAFDVNPPVWKTFAERGIAVRGPAAATLGLDPEPDRLADWNRRNLQDYWRPWAQDVLARPSGPFRRAPRWRTAWGVLGVSRMHRTITTGEVVSKEAAGEHALATFDERWHPIVAEALAYWREAPADPAFADLAVRRRAVGEFCLDVIDACGREPAAGPEVA